MSRTTISVPKEAPMPIPILAPGLRADVGVSELDPEVVVVGIAAEFEGKELRLKLVLIVDGLEVALTSVSVKVTAVVSVPKGSRIEKSEQLLPLQ